MGRVYNALVRAEQWHDADHPIGRPDRKDSPRIPSGDGPPAVPINVSSAPQAPSALQGGLRASGALVTPAAVESVHSGATNLVPRAAPLSSRAVADRRIPNAPVSTFDEPCEVLNIRDLAIDKRVARLTREDPLAVERYRALAVKLINLSERRKLKTILITSADAGEGKTTVATVLALALAKDTERRVLLIDANPTSLSVGRTLGLNPKRGWRNLVDRSCELKRAIVRVDPNGLSVLTPGPQAASQSADAIPSRLETVIGELAQRFDLIIVDSPAILESPETQRLAAVLDGAVLVALAGHTHHSRVTAARKLVPKERRLGLVLNESEGGVGFPQRRRWKSSFITRLFGQTRLTA